jgi:hypothetical protein
MNQVISWAKTIRVRVLPTIFFVVTVLLMSATFGYGNSLTAQAKPLTPEATSYQVARTDGENAQEQDGLPNKKLIENSQQQLKSTADTVREKLNLDQPIYPPTKEFLNTVQDSAKEAVQAPQKALEKTVDTVTGNQ